MLNLSYDLHIHSCLSPCGDDDMTPGNIVGMAKVIGLDVIALTDHNTCRNCPAFGAIAASYGITAIFGMELTTAEEVHVLCYFSSLADALSFDSYVYQHIPDVPNRPTFFGNQLLCDETDTVIGTEPRLLISATSIAFQEVYELVRQFHGVMVPAHISKPTTSLLGNLGFIPENSRFRCAEISRMEDIEALRAQHPYLRQCSILCSSDAHDLNTLHEPIYRLQASENSPAAILAAIDPSS